MLLSGMSMNYIEIFQRQLIKHEEITPLKETIKEVIEQSKSKKTK